MTRRIALAILLTVWAALVAGCLVAYTTVRWALIEQLDRSLMNKASGVAELARVPPGMATRPAVGAAAATPTTRPATRSAFASRARAPVDRYVVKTDKDFSVSKPAGGMVLADPELLEASFSALADGTPTRNVLVRGVAEGPDGRPLPVTVAYISDASHLFRLLDRLALAFAAFGIAAGLLAALVALWVSRAALRPLHATADVIGEISPRNLHRRIDARQLPPELVPMASRLNEMLERIERAYVQRHQFLADASHELRTPVAALVTAVEVSLRLPRAAEAYRGTLESCLSDARLLRQLVERLMEQCRADELSHDEPTEDVDLAPLLTQCADQAAVLARELGVAVRADVPPSLHLTTQPQRLRSVVTNLLSNAVEYNRPGGRVELTVRPNAQFIHLTVRDTGPGIAAEHLPHLFEPFYRADRARTVSPGHLGLGLSLVHSHVAALGGSVRVESTPGEGTAFHVDVPVGPGGRAEQRPA
jgi:heavy metal sensor kinase